MLRVRLILAGVIIVAVGCSLLLPADSNEVNEHFVGWFCLDPDNPHQNYIYMVPNRFAINGRGRGLLPGLSPTEDWNYHGFNPYEGGPIRVKITLEGEGLSGREYVAWLLEDSNSIELRDIDGPWRTDPLVRCR